jgi:hypothetical protein
VKLDEIKICLMKCNKDLSLSVKPFTKVFLKDKLYQLVLKDEYTFSLIDERGVCRHIFNKEYHERFLRNNQDEKWYECFEEFINI